MYETPTLGYTASWIDTNEPQRPPEGARCAITWTDDAAQTFYGLAIYYAVGDRWDQSRDLDEFEIMAFHEVDAWIFLPDA